MMRHVPAKEASSNLVHLRRFAVFVAVLSLIFAKVLYDLVVFAAASDRFNYVLVIPVLSCVLIWMQDHRERTGFHRSPVRAAALVILGVAALLGFWTARSQGWAPQAEDYLALTVLSYYAFLVAGGFLLLGGPLMRRWAFSFALLLFMIPFPAFLTEWTEIFFQHTSAYATHLMLSASGVPMRTDGLVFELPGISIVVARECSGIRSSLVLFVVGLVAGHLFLTTFWRKVALALLVIPLSIIRNGFRISTLSLLAVYDDPGWVDSPLHHNGGPVFFALSLIPFFLLLMILRRSERVRGPEAKSVAGPSS